MRATRTTLIRVKQPRRLSLFALLALLLAALVFPQFRAQILSVLDEPAATPTSAQRHAIEAEPVGFRSTRALDEHFAKHGAEFGRITRDEYLRLACELRDAPAGGAIVEARRADGVITRFDRRSGAFLAFNADRTLRTFFKPNDGLAYFERQLEREGER